MKLEPEAVLATLDEDRISKLRSFAAMLAGMGAHIGLVSRDDRDRVWDRHVLDSLRALACMPAGPVRLADVGSGGGLPGIPLAVVRPEVGVTLIEPRGGRVAFLEKAVQELGLQNAQVAHGRAQDLSGGFDVCTARALAGPLATWRIANHLLGPQGRVVYFAGRSFGQSDVDDLLAEGVSANICATGLFPGSGSLVIMQFGS